MGNGNRLAVVFDLYGTLVTPPSGDTAHRRLARMASERGGDGKAVRECMVSESTLTEFSKARYPGLFSEFELAEMEDAARAEASASVPYGDTAGFLGEMDAKGWVWGVCSNLARPFETVLERLPSKPAFKALSFAEGFLKPSPWIMSNSLKSGLLDCRRIVVVGDSDESDGGLAKALGGWFLRVDRKGVGRGAASLGSLLPAMESLASEVRK